MTMHENARFTVERTVTEYNFEDRKHGSNEFSYWEVLAIIKNAYILTAIKKWEAERYCELMHCSFKEMLTA